jgi:predicted component of type VI protein secretion system
MAYLSVHYHDKPPYQRKLDGEIVIGRALGCQMWLDDGRLSRRHCRVHPEGDHWVLEDLGSTNGTFVREQPVTRYILRDGDSFEAGDSRIVFHADDDRMHTRRPADPASASQIGRAMIDTMLPESEPPPANIGHLPRVPHLRAMDTGPQNQKHEQAVPKIPLAFARPPAQPIVGDDPRSGRRSSWWRALTGWMRR